MLGFFRKKQLGEQPKTKIGKAFGNVATYSKSPILTQQQVVEKFSTAPFLHLCVDKIAKSVATNQWNLYKKQRNGDKTLIKSDKLLDLLEKPNPYMTKYDFMYTVQAMLDLHGNVYIMYERDNKGAILNLWIVTPSMVTQEPNSANKYTYQVVLNSISFTVPITELIHIKEINMSNPYGKGVGTSSTVAPNVQIVENATQQVNSFFYNNMTPEGIIGIDDFDEDALLEFKEKWMSEQQGFYNSYKMQFLNTSDFKYVPTKSSFKDSQVREITKDQQEAIRIAFGISPEVLGIVESSNRATAMTAKELFQSEVIEPRLTKIKEILNVTLVQEFNKNYYIDYKLKSDAKTERMLTLVQTMPSAFKLNEIRELAGLEPIAELDSLYGGETNDSSNNSK